MPDDPERTPPADKEMQQARQALDDAQKALDAGSSDADPDTPRSITRETL